MSEFIMLTESMTGGDTRPLLLPVSQIVHVQSGQIMRKDTHIRMIDHAGTGKSPYYFVKESIQEIAAKLGAK